jgi:hypothetical protein
MDTEPVNPFQSPRAVDELPNIHACWRPRWSDVMLGLVGFPGVFLVSDTLIGWFAYYLLFRDVVEGSLRYWELIDWAQQLKQLMAFCLLTAVVTVLFRVLWLKNHFHPWVILCSGAGISLLLVLIALDLLYGDNEWAPSDGLSSFIHVAVFPFVKLLIPFLYFALYLAYLRRRDQNRGGEPRG